MNKTVRQLLICSVILSAGCFVFSLFSDNLFLSFTNNLSILSLMLLVAGLLNFLVSGGYFDFMNYSFSSARKWVMAKGEKPQHESYFEYEQKKQKERGKSSHFILKLALILLTVSIILTFVYSSLY